MNADRVKSKVGRWGLGILAAAVLTAQVLPAAAQTPDAACAADSLYLISPPSLDLRLETTGKTGLTVSWPNLDLNQATCFSLSETGNLDFTVTVDGGFGDRVDRVFGFTTNDSGVIGGPNAGNITFTWQNQGSANNGNIGGVFNLSNNGGLWNYSQSGAAWAQENNGLPMSWQRTNVTALDRGTGEFAVAAFTRGVAMDSESAGLYKFNGTNWARLAPTIFTSVVSIKEIAVSRTNNDWFAVGTDGSGLFVTTDGGETFTQWRSELNPTAPVTPTTYRVTALSWESDRLLVFMPTWGLYISEDDGASFVKSPITVPDNLDLAVGNQTQIMPTINDFSVDPADADRIVAALNFHGAYETLDGGASWHDLYGDLIVAVPGQNGAWSHSAAEILVDGVDPQVIVMAVAQKGIYRTSDGGVTWVTTAEEAGLQPANRAELINFSLIRRQGLPGDFLLMENGWKLLHSTDSGLTWAAFAQQPLLKTALVVVSKRDSSGDFMLGSNSGGIYVAGTTIPLTETYSTTTSASLRSLDLGLNITFDGGNAQAGDFFELVAQTFQGWAVWRGPSHEPENMTLVGLFDRVNPEDCFEGYCGDNSLEIVPQCFAAKRAACFDLSNPDTLRFFDEEVYNGFSYNYAVSSFDYGNTGLTTPQNNTNEMLFSPRWLGDELSPYSGSGNQQRVDVNEPGAAATGGDEIYAYPNPVRLGAGVPGGEGRTVVFTNLPEGASIRIFTTAGDDVIMLGNEGQTGGQLYWQTNNRDGEDVAAGVYLYKVEMPAREAYWGRIVVIR